MGREAGPLRCGSVTDPPKWSISLCCPKKHLILDNNSFYFNEGEWVYLNLIIENPALFVFQIIPDQTPQADVPSLQRAYIFLGASCHFRFASHKLFETSWVPSHQTLGKPMNIQPVDPQPNPPESAKHSPEKQRNAVNMDLNPERLEISRLELGSPENVMLNLLMSVRISPFPATSLSRILLTLFAKKNCCVHTDAVSKADGKTCHFNTTPCLKSQKGQDIFNSPLHLSC